MTTVVQVRQSLQALSMSSQPESRRKSKRLAGTYDVGCVKLNNLRAGLEADMDFVHLQRRQFTMSKMATSCSRAGPRDRRQRRPKTPHPRPRGSLHQNQRLS